MLPSLQIRTLEKGIFTVARVLLIDDDPLMRRIVSQTLDGSYEVVEAESGPEGLQAAVDLHPDLILLDVMMAGMDGFQVCYQLRRQSITFGIPIIMLTALGEMNEKVHGMQVGADDYITKPFDPRELRARIQAHLRRSARDQQASPLTMLPGNAAIEQVMRSRIDSGEPVAVLYSDLSNFKMYNDKYGWLAGDHIIKWLGKMIVEVVLDQGAKDDFVGHVGGDDFVIVTLPGHAEAIAREIIRRFDVEIPNHYGEDDRAKGYIEGTDRQGRVLRVPIMTLQIAIVTNEVRILTHPLQVSQIAAQVKAYAKSLDGSQYAFDRRRG